MLRRRTFFMQYPATIADCYHCNAGQVAINMLPDDTLLEVFDFVLLQNDCIDAWHPLVHVCRKWRYTVFGSPRRLNLHLHCTGMRKSLTVWPDLPIVIGQYDPPMCGTDSILAALEKKDRVCEIMIRHISNSQWENVSEAMQVPLPALTRLELVSEDEAIPVVPDSFLGGSAPRLRSLSMTRIPFPGLPGLITNATDLVNLELHGIPQSGYFSPEMMATCLSTLTSLESLHLEFEFPRPRPIQERGRPPPQTHFVLPALAYFSFRGDSEYLENLVAKIDAPLLDGLHITFFHQLIFDTPQLAWFISRTPNLKAHNEAQVTFFNDSARVQFGSTQQFSMRTRCKPSDWQISFLEQVCNSSLSIIPSLEHLYIREGIHSRPCWQEDIEGSQWLELLHAFTNVKNLYLSKGVFPRITPALQELVGERLAEVLPALEGLFLEEPQLSGPVQETIQNFVELRQLSGFPIAVSHWDRTEHKR